MQLVKDLHYKPIPRGFLPLPPIHATFTLIKFKRRCLDVFCSVVGNCSVFCSVVNHEFRECVDY